VQARLRPRVEFFCPCSPSEVFDRVRRYHEGTDPKSVRLQMGQSHLGILLPQDQIHYWSPWLDLHVGEEAGGGTRVCGRFAPSPAVWTMFMAIYATFCFAAFVGVSLALAEWMMNTPQWGWFLAAGALAGWTLTYAAAMVGQGLGNDQVHQLQAFIEAAMRFDEADTGS